MTPRPGSVICHTTTAAVLVSTVTLLLQLQQPVELLAQPNQKDTTDGLDYSIDRIAYEVTKSLTKRPALVIWLLDESGSVSIRRAETVTRLKELYATTTRPHPLYSAVVGFGEDTHFLTPQPVNDFEALKQAAEQLQHDTSGVETVFGALLESLDRWKTFPGNGVQIDVSLIIVTDEVGDDQDRLEDAVKACNGLKARVFCLGNAAPFGQSKGRSHFIYPDDFKEFIPVDQGPEVAIPDTLRLPIWPSADPDPLKQVSSGFGPWALSRLCTATGGQFFIVEDTSTVTFPRAVMRAYTPSYDSLADQQKSVKTNQLRRTLAECAADTRQTIPSSPHFSIRADSRTTARVELADAQKTLVTIHDLATSSVSKLKLCADGHSPNTDQRLQAAFDLAYGRAMLQAVRARELNHAWAERRLAPTEFHNTSSNTWHLLAAPTREPLAANRDVATRGTALLRRVTAQHPNTPFAYIAQAELDRGTGWRWEESHRVYNNPPDTLVRPLLIRGVDRKTRKRRAIPKERPKL